jgi:hypothetical protein
VENNRMNAADTIVTPFRLLATGPSPLYALSAVFQAKKEFPGKMSGVAWETEHSVETTAASAFRLGV